MLGHGMAHNVDMTQGPVARNILRFALPLIAASLLQRLFNAVDVIVVGRFAGDTALAAITSTLSLIDLMLDSGLGLSMGANVVAANALGHGDNERVRKVAHTAILLALLFGGVLTILGVSMAGTLLGWMSSPDGVREQSALYLRLYLLGLPALTVYNFGSALLRANGDTRRPTYYLILAGGVKMALNLIFVPVLHMSVAGAALATTLSNLIAGGMVLRALLHESSVIRIDPRRLAVDGGCLGRIAYIGLPAAVQGALFAVSNITIQSSINSMGEAYMAGFGASGNIEGFLFVAMNGVTQACLTFTSRNHGAGELRRVDQVRRWSLLLVAATGLAVGSGFLLLRRQLLGIYISGAEAVAAGLLRASFMLPLYFVYGLSDVYVAAQRGLGSATVPMILSLLGVCAFRVGWVYTVFASNPTPTMLILSYPISWVITLASQATALFFTRRRVFAKVQAALAAQSE